MATATSAPTVYDDTFFNILDEGALRSARIVLDLLFRLVRPARVIDVGCGRGPWLKASQELGVEEVLGVDGAYVDPNKLLINRSHFRPENLFEPLQIEGSFDLAICLEVVEHLPSRTATALVQRLTALSPVVLFSAAIPGQPGCHHINLRWPSYWREVFASCGYERLDPIRRQVWFDRRVEWWYRQNIFLYVSREVLAGSPTLQTEHELSRDQDLELVFRQILEKDRSVISRFRALGGSAWQSLRRLLRCLTRSS